MKYCLQESSFFYFFPLLVVQLYSISRGPAGNQDHVITWAVATFSYKVTRRVINKFIDAH